MQVIAAAAGEPITHGLIIGEPWVSKILAGTKGWEMRSNATARRGRIALIRKGSGRVVGTAKLVDTLPAMTSEELSRQFDQHGIPDTMLFEEGYKWRIPWVLEEVQELLQPVPYKHKSGAVIWVELDPAAVQVLNSGSSQSKESSGEMQGQDKPVVSVLHPAENAPLVTALPGKEPLDVPLSLKTPQARDGTRFTPDLERKGQYTIGAKGDEIQVANFSQALTMLADMDVPRWRRPNSSGNWGIVSGICWVSVTDIG